MTDEASLHSGMALGLLGLALVTLLLLGFVSAPYGRHQRPGWGPSIPARVGWVVMESPSCLLFVPVFLAGRHNAEFVPRLFLLLWLVHYVYRTFVFPFRMRAQGRRMPLVVAGLALGFQLVNCYLNARYISHLGTYSARWLVDPRCVVGLLLFCLGLCINHHSDAILLRLRTAGDTGYRIPQGGLFRWVSCPNYLGEILEWTGWAVGTWSLAGLAFAAFTVANLVPRARAHHRFYQSAFADYPGTRKALVPYVW
jgi:protein-S-isoprenylcysteine O-methyltransferase Ste14